MLFRSRLGPRASPDTETHMDMPLAALLNSRYPLFMLQHYIDPDHTQEGGVSIIINTHMIKSPPTSISTPVPGRALTLTLEWPTNSPINILAIIYAPNISSTGHKSKNFWQTLDQSTQNHQIDILLGDFNVTEEAVDRFPPREDTRPAVATLQTLTSNLLLTDGWRRTNPHPEKHYTFSHSSGAHMSHINRIYALECILQKAFKWDICLPGLPTVDHQLVLMEMHNETAPSIGGGRWVIPLFLIEDREFIKEVTTLAKDTLKLMTHNENECPFNLQTVFQALIQVVTNLTKSLERIKAGKMNSAIKKLKKCRDRAEKKSTITTQNTWKQPSPTSRKSNTHTIKKLKAQLRQTNAYMQSQSIDTGAPGEKKNQETLSWR